MTLDIDDTVDVVHGHQQLSLFNAHHDERCFMPIHVYDIATSRPVVILLRPGKTPSGHEVRCHVRRLVRRIRSHWPATKLTICGDGHYGRPKVMAWCEANAVNYIFGLPGNAVLGRLLEEAADDVRVRRAEAQVPVLRCYAEIRYGAKSWGMQTPGLGQDQATTLGLDIRCVVTNRRTGTAEWLYDTLYCARGQAENLIKLHKSQLASDRTSCRSALANQVRLVLHTAAYWLMLTVRDAVPKPQPLATAEFATLSMRLIKIAGRVTETAARVRIAFAAACPEAELFRGVARSLQPALQDSHKSDTSDAVEHGVETGVTLDQDDRTGFAVIPGPAAQTGADPGGMGERACGMRVLLSHRAAFQRSADSLDRGLVGGVEDIRHGTCRQSVAGVEHLLDVDGGDQRCAAQVLQRHGLADRHCFDVEAAGFHHPEHLLDHPALAIQPDDPLRVGQCGGGMRGHKPPVQGRHAEWRVDLARVDHGQGGAVRQRRCLLPSSRRLVVSWITSR